ncbi:MAG: YceI family protein [Bacteroidales bacterium]|nr:YceI family protein [Bacteroidales bacterium]
MRFSILIIIVLLNQIIYIPGLREKLYTDKKAGKIVVADCESYVNVKVGTNVSEIHFKLQIEEAENITNTIINKKDLELKNNYYEIRLPVKKFTTGNEMMYKDFINLLNAERYPEIIISLEKSQIKKIQKEMSVAPLEIKINISGVINNYCIVCNINHCLDGITYISGEKQIRLTEYNIKPPVKFFGLVKVNNEINVNFVIPII